MRKVFIRLRCVLSNTLDVVVMKGHASVIGSHTGLWMMLSAGALAVLLVLACAGAAAGAEDTIEVRSGTYVENVDVEKRLMLQALALDENATVNATWNDIRIYGDPTQYITALIDPLDEIDEDNNEMECEIVMNYPDFEIGHFESPTEYRGARVTIKNTGIGGADDINVTFEMVRREDYSLIGTRGYYAVRHVGLGAAYIRVHFDYINIPDSGGNLKIAKSISSLRRGDVIETYRGDVGDVWCPWVGGDKFLIDSFNAQCFKVDGYEWGDVEEETIDHLGGGGSDKLEMKIEDWGWKYTEPMNLAVRVDPDDKIHEIDEDNNNETVLVYADLRADRIVFVSPQEDKLSLDAEKFVIDGTIANRGDEDGIIVPVSDFDVTLEFRNRYPNGTVGDLVFDVTEHVEEPLYANEDRAIRFEFDPSEELEVGGNYTVSLIADSSGDVCESSELYPDGEDNNITSMNIYVYNSSGYAGGSNLTNVAQGEVHGRVVYTIGDSRYAGLTHPGEEETVRYTGVIPDDACDKVELARIFVYWYTWHMVGGRVVPVLADVNVTFNGHNLTNAGNYSDNPGATAWDAGYGMYSYDVTDYVTSGENEAAVKNNAEWNMGIHAIGLLVVYEDEDEPLTKYWISEGADIMMAANREIPTGLPSGNCITTATFEDVKRNDTENVNAALLTVLGVYTQFGESDLVSDEGDTLRFNNQSIGSLIGTGYWKRQYPAGIALTMNGWEDVTDYLKHGDNLAEIQSLGNFMMPNNAFLRLIFPPDLNITDLTAPDGMVVGKEYPINVIIRNDGRSDAHDFNVTLYIDTMQMTCIPHLDLPAGNSTTLHLHNWTPMMLDHVYNLTVTVDILTGADWTEAEADNNVMIVDTGVPGVGDLNGDNKITPADAAIALQIAAGGSASCDPTTLAAADVSGDNRVTSLDALMIMQAAAGRIEL